MADGKITPRQQGATDKPLLKKWKFMAGLMADPELSGTSKSVAFALMDILNNEDGYARPGHPKIAERAATTVSSVKRGIKELQGRGWFCVSPVFDGGEQKANRYFPIWKRETTGQPPAGSERTRKVRPGPAPKVERPAFAFENGPAQLTAAEVARIEALLGPLADEFFHEMRTTDFGGDDDWRGRIERMIEATLYAEEEEEPF